MSLPLGSLPGSPRVGKAPLFLYTLLVRSLYLCTCTCPVVIIVLSLVSFPLLTSLSARLDLSLLYPQHLEEFLVNSRHLININW